MKKRMVAMLMASMMTLTAFAGCGESGQGNAEKENTEVSQESNSQETSTESEEENLFAEEVNLVYVLPAVADTYPGLEAVEEELSKITKEKINATITLEMIPLGEYTEKMNMKFTSGEEFDLCFTGAWNPYLSAVSKGAYAELTEEVLNTYAPEYMTQLNSAAWDAVRVNGKIYGAPIEQIYVRQTGIRFATDLAEKYDFDYSTVTSLDDLDSYLDTIKENEPDVVPFYTNDIMLMSNFTSYMGFDMLVSENVPGAVYYAADTPTVVNQFATEEFKELCKKMREWNQAGYFPADAVTGADSAQGKVRAATSDPAHKPGGDITESRTLGFNVDGVAIGNCAMTTSAVQATVTAVSATSKNVERAVAFINLLNTDKNVLNLLCHGIEGVDWQFVGDESEGVIETIGEWPGIYSFFIGNVFNEYYSDPAMVGTWEETAEINKNAQASCILGFAFDSEPVATQIAQCTAVAEEHLPAITTGAIDTDEGIAAFLEALEQAGVDEIIAEMQAQVDAWVATK